MPSDLGPMASKEPATAEPHARKSDRGSAAMVLGVSVGLIFFGGLAAWSATAAIDSAAVAPGTVQVENNRFSIDHPEGGVIEALLVRDGDVVEQGQLLLRIDSVEAQARLSALQRRDDRLAAMRARLLAEERGATDIDYPHGLMERAQSDGELQQLLETQSALFRASLQSFASQLEVSEQRIVQLEEQIVGLQGQLTARTSQLALIDEELIDLQRLLEEGLVTQARTLALRREQANLQGQAAGIQSDMAQVRAAIGQTRIQVILDQRARAEALGEQLRDTIGQTLELDPQIRALEATIARSELIAPTDGVVFGLAYGAAGEVVRPAETILQIVPSLAELVVEAQISPVDRDVVSAGMTTKVRLLAANAQTVPPVTGELVRISADAEVDDNTGLSHYAAIIRLMSDDVADLGLELSPGMPVEAIVPLQRRTPIEFLIEPLVRNWGEAFRVQ